MYACVWIYVCIHVCGVDVYACVWICSLCAHVCVGMWMNRVCL